MSKDQQDNVDRPDAGEDPERLNRNLSEQLQELRVVQAGVQILFAFLLTLPFTNRFNATTEMQRYVYFVALLSAAAAAAMLIAPVSYHRILFRRKRRPLLVRATNRFTIAGLGFTLLGMSASVLMVADYLLGSPGGWIIGGAVFAWFTMWWLIVPFAQRQHHPELADPPPAVHM